MNSFLFKRMIGFVLICWWVVNPVFLNSGNCFASELDTLTSFSLPRGVSRIIKFDENVSKVALGDPSIADVTVLSLKEVMISAIKVGRTELFIWVDRIDASPESSSENPDLTALESTVDYSSKRLITYNLGIYDNELWEKSRSVLGRDAMKNVNLHVVKDNTVMIRGRVSSRFESEQLEKISQVYYSEVVNLLEYPRAAVQKTWEEDRLNDQREIELAKSARIFQLKYIDPSTIKEELNSLKSETGNIIFHDSSRTIIVNDLPGKLEIIAEAIRAFDQKPRQVQIDARIVEVMVTDDSSSTVSWIYNQLYSGINPLNTELNNQSVLLEGGNMTVSLDVGKINGEHFAARIMPLLSKRNGRLLSNPRIITLSGQEASIDVGDNVPYVTYQTQGTTGTLVPSVEHIQAGVSLKVKPIVNYENTVSLEIYMNVSSITEQVDLGQYGSIPSTNDRKATTQIILADGETMIIGGLIRDDVVQTNSKVPLLGDLPLIKKVFRGKSSTLRKTELLLFLTPRVIEDQIWNEIPTGSIVEPLIDENQRWKENIPADEIGKVGRNISRPETLNESAIAATAAPAAEETAAAEKNNLPVRSSIRRESTTKLLEELRRQHTQD